MASLGENRLNRACALLCLALTLVFAGKSMASAVHYIQHHSTLEASQGHSILGAFLSASHPEAGYDKTATDAGHSKALGHHHHADAGASVFPSPQLIAIANLWRSVHYAPSAQFSLCSHFIGGSDQPPKSPSFRI